LTNCALSLVRPYTFCGLNSVLASFRAMLLIAPLLAAGISYPAAWQQVPSPPRERFLTADVVYDWVSNNHGEKLRTFIV